MAKVKEKRHYTDEELEREFEEALRSVNNDRLTVIHIFSKTTTFLITVITTILSILGIIGGGVLVCHHASAILMSPMTVESYFYNGILSIFGLLMVLLGCGIANDYLL